MYLLQNYLKGISELLLSGIITITVLVFQNSVSWLSVYHLLNFIAKKFYNNILQCAFICPFVSISISFPQL